MGNKTNFELITPSQTVINQEVDMVVVPGSEGHFGVLSLHAHTLSTLNKGIVKLYENGNSINEIIVDGGIADVNPSGCTLLVEKAEILKNINKSEQVAKNGLLWAESHLNMGAFQQYMVAMLKNTKNFKFNQKTF